MGYLKRLFFSMLCLCMCLFFTMCHKQLATTEFDTLVTQTNELIKKGDCSTIYQNSHSKAKTDKSLDKFCEGVNTALDKYGAIKEMTFTDIPQKQSSIPKGSKLMITSYKVDAEKGKYYYIYFIGSDNDKKLRMYEITFMDFDLDEIYKDKK